MGKLYTTNQKFLKPIYQPLSLKNREEEEDRCMNDNTRYTTPTKWNQIRQQLFHDSDLDKDNNKNEKSDKRIYVRRETAQLDTWISDNEIE